MSSTACAWASHKASSDSCPDLEASHAFKTERKGIISCHVGTAGLWRVSNGIDMRQTLKPEIQKLKVGCRQKGSSCLARRASRCSRWSGSSCAPATAPPCRRQWRHCSPRLRRQQVRNLGKCDAQSSTWRLSGLPVMVTLLTWRTRIQHQPAQVAADPEQPPGLCRHHRAQGGQMHQARRQQPGPHLQQPGPHLRQPAARRNRRHRRRPAKTLPSASPPTGGRPCASTTAKSSSTCARRTR